MKRTHKGFTLVELLIVIGIIGLLGSMAMIGGSEANNIATANKILEEMRVIGGAMNLFYADNRKTIDSNTSFAATDIKTGIAAYMKSTDGIDTQTAGSELVGKYNISIDSTTNQWWLSYKLPEANTKVALILANKAASEGLRNAAVDAESTPAATEGSDPTNNLYVATAQTVYMRVR